MQTQSLRIVLQRKQVPELTLGLPLHNKGLFCVHKNPAAEGNGFLGQVVCLHVQI